MKIALAQMEIIAGAPEKNVAKMLQWIEKARSEGADLVVFPELAVGGYLLGDRWLEDHFCRELMSYNAEIQKASRGIAVVYGNVYLDERKTDGGYHPNRDGRTRKYNAVYAFQNGKLVSRSKPVPELPEGIQPKTLLPNYRFFDEERYFFSIISLAGDFGCDWPQLLYPFLIWDKANRQIPVGMEICEDLWCKDYRGAGKALNPTQILLEHGAMSIINISSSPWTYGKNNARDRRIQFLKKEAGDMFRPFFYVNCTGAQNNGKNIVTFDGGSTIYNAAGLPIRHSREAYQEELLIVEEKELTGDVQPRAEKKKIAQKFDALLTGIRHMKNMVGSTGDPRFIIGLSGGVDSAVVAALLVLSVGTGKVLAVNMPSQFNSARTRKTAKAIAAALNIPLLEIPIDELAKMNQELLDREDPDGSGQKLSVLNLENLQAKIRGTAILSNLAGKYHALFTNNGNKLEIALGYATLYGDVGGALAPIGDLTKEEVFDLARFLNREVFHAEVIPASLIPDELFRFGAEQIQPTAELKDNQIDPMRFGYHCRMLEQMTDYLKKTSEDIMEWYLEGTLAANLGISPELLKRWEVDKPEVFIEDLEWFCRQIQLNVFKRIQGPPIIITSKSAYGYDIRESILPLRFNRRHEELSEKILEMKKQIYQERRT